MGPMTLRAGLLCVVATAGCFDLAPGTDRRDGATSDAPVGTDAVVLVDLPDALADVPELTDRFDASAPSDAPDVVDASAAVDVSDAVDAGDVVDAGVDAPGPTDVGVDVVVTPVDAPDAATGDLGSMPDSGACAPELSRCSGACVNLFTDAANCGGCGVACTTGQVCVSGACAADLPTAPTMTLGSSHGCAVTAAGLVRCWGYNGQGQAGQSFITTPVVSAPTLVSGVANVLGVVATTSSTCAWTMAGSVLCWGDNYFGQLGDGFTSSGFSARGMAGAVPGLTEVVEMSAGSHHFCARRRDGSVRCWGFNRDVQLGDGSMLSRARPVAVSGLGPVRQLASGGASNCAVLQAGGVRCWGANGSGQLGDGTLDPPFELATSLLPIDTLEVCMGGAFGCARLSGGTVQCWGYGADGAIGNGMMVMRATPAPVTGIVDAVQVACGETHACARLRSGALRCWGGNQGGQLGNGSLRTSDLPVEVVGVTNAVEVRLQAGSLARLADGSLVYCHVIEDDLSRATDFVTPQTSPAPVQGLDQARAVSVGGSHACALRSDGTVRCWGSNSNGQIGDGTALLRATATSVPAVSNVVSLSSGSSHTCAATATGEVWCWGANTYGQLGDGTRLDRFAPTRVSGLSGVSQVSASGAHTCARLGDGSVRCWGYNDQGRLGTGTTIDSVTPVAVPGLDQVVELNASLATTCARRMDGTVRCWGLAPLGNGTRTTASTPTLLPGITTAAWVRYPFVGLADGTVRAWGNSTGDGTTMERLSPVTVTVVDTRQPIAVSNSSRCAQNASGSVTCWGDNTYGELGDGGRTNSLTGVTVPGLTGVDAVVGRSSVMCALRSTGAVVCWGDNRFGQTGNGAGPITPTRVMGFP